MIYLWLRDRPECGEPIVFACRKVVALIRVASVPAAHNYVAAVTDPEHIALLDDPVPPGATVAGQWWPPRWLEPGYLSGRIGEIDILHVHFGFDTTPPDVLVDVCRVLSAHRVPLVLTVHDLDNPHLTNMAQHHGCLDVLVRHAAAVITLTVGAAEAVSARWHRRPAVLSHPHVLPVEAVGAPRKVRSRTVVGVHAKHLRANVDPWPVLDSLATGAREFGIRLDLDDNALTSPRASEATPHRLARYAAAGVDVRVHAPFSDAQLVEYLSEIDILVLPYRFGTHSGWIEACHDAGVCAVVPDCGYFHEQHDVPTYGYDPSGLDEAGLARAVDAAVNRVRCAAVGVDLERRERRKAQRRQVRHETVRIYRRLIGEESVA